MASYVELLLIYISITEGQRIRLNLSCFQKARHLHIFSRPLDLEYYLSDKSGSDFW